MSRARTIANELTKAERLFVLSAPGKAPVPDAIWHGRHRDLIEDGNGGWKKSALCHEVASIIAPGMTDMMVPPESIDDYLKANPPK